MNIEYNGKLSFGTCAHNCSAESNHYESCIRCMFCLREYLGGYNELLQTNRHQMKNTKTQVEAAIRDQVLLNMNRSVSMN